MRLLRMLGAARRGLVPKLLSGQVRAPEAGNMAKGAAG